MSRILRTMAMLTVVTLLVVATLSPAAASTMRPFHGWVRGAADVAEDATCPIGLRTLSEATGPVTHLGLSTMVTSHCTPNPPFGNPPGPIVGGTVTFTAANGDRLTGTYEGTVEPLAGLEGDTIRGVVHVTFNGGTGRFDGASGHAAMPFVGTLHFTQPMTMTWMPAGHIEY